jgi:uncharacterized protein
MALTIQENMHNPTEIFIYYLERLQVLVDKIERLSEGNTNILNARLHDDMLPLINQITTTANFALRGCCPLAGRTIVSFQQNQSSFSALRQCIADTIAYLTDIPLTEFDRPATEVLREQAGFTQVALQRDKFLQHYILPNFYFHLSMVYAIARSRGIPLSKQDYDGYHQYPEGFSFVK